MSRYQSLGTRVYPPASSPNRFVSPVPHYELIILQVGVESDHLLNRVSLQYDSPVSLHTDRAHLPEEYPDEFTPEGLWVSFL